MRSKLIADSPKTFALILETGDEVLSSLKTFAQAEHLSSSSFKAIGALSPAEFGWFNWETQKYQTAIKLENRSSSCLSLETSHSRDKEPQVHAHLVVGRRDGAAHGGHLIGATVRPTCEIVFTVSPQHLQKEIDAESGPALIGV